MAWHTKSDFIALLKRTNPAWFGDFLDDLTGKEAYEAQAAIFEYLSGKIESLFEQLNPLAPRESLQTTGEATVTNEASCPVLIYPHGCTFYGTRHGGKTLAPYHPTETLVLDPDQLLSETITFDESSGLASVTWDGSNSESGDVAVEAAIPGMDQDVLAGNLRMIAGVGTKTLRECVLFDNGSKILCPASQGEFDEDDSWRVVEITSANDDGVEISALAGKRRQIVFVDPVEGVDYTVVHLLGHFETTDDLTVRISILDLSTAGVRVQNDSDLIGGSFPVLQLFMINRGQKKRFDEPDERAVERMRTLPDMTSPNAIERAVKRIMNRYGVTDSWEIVSSIGHPDVCGFFGAKSDAYTSYQMLVNGTESESYSYSYSYPYPYSYEEETESAYGGWAVDRERMRGYFWVLVPALEYWSDEDRKQIHRSIWETIEAIRAGGVGWEMLIHNDEN